MKNKPHLEIDYGVDNHKFRIILSRPKENPLYCYPNFDAEVKSFLESELKSGQPSFTYAISDAARANLDHIDDYLDELNAGLKRKDGIETRFRRISYLNPIFKVLGVATFIGYFAMLEVDSQRAGSMYSSLPTVVESLRLEQLASFSETLALRQKTVCEGYKHLEQIEGMSIDSLIATENCHQLVQYTEKLALEARTQLDTLSEDHHVKSFNEHRQRNADSLLGHIVLSFLSAFGVSYIGSMIKRNNNRRREKELKELE